MPRTPCASWEQQTRPEAPGSGEGVRKDSGPAPARQARRWGRARAVCTHPAHVCTPHPGLGARAPGPVARPCPPCPSLGRGAPTSPACPGPICWNSSGGPSLTCCWRPPAGRRPGLTPALGTRQLLLQRPPASVCRAPAAPPAAPPATWTPPTPPLSFLPPVPSFAPLSPSPGPSRLSLWLAVWAP